MFKTDGNLYRRIRPVVGLIVRLEDGRESVEETRQSPTTKDQDGSVFGRGLYEREGNWKEETQNRSRPDKLLQFEDEESKLYSPPSRSSRRSVNQFT